LTGLFWQQSLPAAQTASVFLMAINEMVERLNVRQAARKTHLLINTFLFWLGLLGWTKLKSRMLQEW
jgi:hypothetical protein